VKERTDGLATVVTAEHGKGEIQRGMEVVKFAVGAQRILQTSMSVR
jgi:hypothetical protein